VLVGRRVEDDVAEPNTAGPQVIRNLHGQRIQRLVAVPVRPPEVHFGDGDLDERRRLAGGERRGRAQAGDLDLDAERPIAAALDVDVRAQQPGRAVDIHQGADGRDSRLAPRLEEQRPPDAGRHQLGAPVPPEVAGHLADRVERVGVDVRARAERLAGPLGCRQGSGERDRQRVLADAEQVAHGEPVAAMHVLGAGQLGAVELDGGDGVEPECDEVDLGVTARVVPHECRLVAPVGASDPADQPLVLADVRVGDQPGGHEIEVDAPGHRRRNRRADHTVGYFAADGAHRPAIVQGDSHCHLIANPLP
jgi:hypothetical protein